MNRKDFDSYVAYHSLLREPLTNLPISNRLRNKLYGNAETVEELLQCTRHINSRDREMWERLDLDEKEALQEVLRLITNHPGAVVQVLDKRGNAQTRGV